MRVCLNGALMSAQVEELGENRVRLTVDVSPHELEHAVEHATNDLSESVKIPGFRKGKVPTPVLVSKIGRDRIWVEAVESHISGWFWSAAARTRLRPISPPEYDFELPTTDKEGWSFSATIEVQPTPEIVDWTTLEVPRAEAEVPQELVDQELEALRQTVAELVPADDRPARDGRHARRRPAEPLGRGAVGHRRRARVGTARRGDRDRPRRCQRRGDEGGRVRARGRVGRRRHDHRQAREREGAAGDRRRARAVGERVRHARGPARGHRGSRPRRDRGGDRRRVPRRRRRRARRPRRTFRRAGPLVETRARELLDGFVRSLGRRGIAPDTYFQVTGQSPEVLVAQMHAEAAQSVARELALEAVADRAGIEVSDDDVKALIREQAEAVRRRSRAGDRGHLGARPSGVAAGGPSPSQRARPPRRRRDADLGRARGGPRQAVDA